MAAKHRKQEINPLPLNTFEVVCSRIRFENKIKES